MSPASGSFGSTGGPIQVWTVGWWMTPLLDVSLQAHADSDNDYWQKIRWIEDNTSDEDEAYVRVEILDSTGTELKTGLTGTVNGNYKEISLTDYATVTSSDIYVRFKLYSKTKTPIVSKIEVY